MDLLVFLGGKGGCLVSFFPLGPMFDPRQERFFLAWTCLARRIELRFGLRRGHSGLFKASNVINQR